MNKYSSWLLLLISLSFIEKSFQTEKSSQQIDETTTSNVSKSADRSEGTYYPSPSLTDDDDSTLLPVSVKCDGCVSLVYQIVEAFDKVHSKMKSVKKLPEADVLDIFDTLCSSSNFKGMGIKNVNGVSKLSGPGLEAEDQPGFQMNGGNWPERMSYLCGKIVGDLGEEEIYDHYLSNRDNMEDVLCRGTGVTNSCIDSKTKQKSEKVKRKDEF